MQDNFSMNFAGSRGCGVEDECGGIVLGLFEHTTFIVHFISIVIML